MFETGMSALVLKICSEYAKSLGLNFPPCTQQEINAICEWVDKHTIKDMTISQDGYNVTFTFKTENDTTKEFTFTIPKKVDIDELEKVLKGSDSVVVDRLVDNSGLQVSLAQSVVNDINSKLTKPASPTSDSVITMTADGTVGTKPLSEIGGGKLYKHYISISATVEDGTNPMFDGMIYFEIYSNSQTAFTLNTIPELARDDFYVCRINNIGHGGIGVAEISFDGTNIMTNGASSNPATIAHELYSLYYLIPYANATLVDTVTEV